MEPIPERIPDTGLEGGQIGNQDNHDGFEQNKNSYEEIDVATNGILSALTHGLVSKDRVNEVEKFLGETESTTPDKMADSISLLMMKDLTSFLNTFRSELDARKQHFPVFDNMGVANELNFILTQKMMLYRSFFNILSNTKSIGQEALQKYQNSLETVSNFIQKGGAGLYVFNNEEQEGYQEAVNTFSAIENTASSLYEEIKQRKNVSQKGQASNYQDKEYSLEPVKESDSLDFSSETDLTLIKNVMDLHVAYGVFGVAMACAPIFAPVYTVALLWFIINYEIKPLKVNSKNKINFSKERFEKVPKDRNIDDKNLNLSRDFHVPGLDISNHQGPRYNINPDVLKGVLPLIQPYMNGYIPRFPTPVTGRSKPMPSVVIVNNTNTVVNIPTVKKARTYTGRAPISIKIKFSGVIKEGDSLSKSAPPPPPPPPTPIQFMDMLEIVDELNEVDIELELIDASDESTNEDYETSIPGDWEYGDEASNEIIPFLPSEDMPVFPGNVQKWIRENIHYPLLAIENGIEGRVFVQVVVERDGSISNIKVVRSVDASLDKEAVRVISKMPKWKPGKQRGKAVRVSYTLPIVFQLNQ